MNKRFSSHIFWGASSPLSSLIGICIIILASGRLSYALVCAGALLWVYGLSALIFSAAKNILPKQGKMIIMLFLSAFLCGIYILILSLLNPLLFLGSAFILLLIPPCFLGFNLLENSDNVATLDVFARAILEALLLSGIIILFSLIRESLGFGTLSFPGGVFGFFELTEDAEAFVPLRLLSISAGGILLLGYCIAIYRYIREKNRMIPKDEL